MISKFKNALLDKTMEKFQIKMGGSIESQLSNFLCNSIANPTSGKTIVEDTFTFRDFLKAGLGCSDDSKLRDESIYSHLGATDIVIDDVSYINAAQNSATYNGKKVAWKNSIGIELKFFDNNPAQGATPVDYFCKDIIPNHTKYMGVDKFIQGGHLTYCEHGQLLYDYCKALKILQSPAYTPKEFYLCGLISIENTLRTNYTCTIKTQIEKLLIYFKRSDNTRCPELYNYDQNKKIQLFAAINHFPLEDPAVDVGNGINIQYKSKNYTRYPYFITVK